jgi:hypothetical protein
MYVASENMIRINRNPKKIKYDIFIYQQKNCRPELALVSSGGPQYNKIMEKNYFDFHLKPVENLLRFH